MKKEIDKDDAELKKLIHQKKEETEALRKMLNKLSSDSKKLKSKKK